MQEEEWQKKLTPEQYRVLREEGTEYPFTGKFLYHKDTGTYTCAACGAELFNSEHKFDSTTGWPSFSDVMDTKAVNLREDNSHGMHRIKVSCAKCGGHLGHVFPSGLSGSDQHYCINSVSLDFKPTKPAE